MPDKSDKTDEVLEKVKTAFPNGDLDGHRKAHEKMIKDIEDRKNFFRDLVKDSLKYALHGAWIVLAFLLLQGLQSQFAIWVNKSVDTPRAVPQVPTGSTK